MRGQDACVSRTGGRAQAEALPGLLADWPQDPSSEQGLGQAGSSEEQVSVNGWSLGFCVELC